MLQADLLATVILAKRLLAKFICFSGSVECSSFTSGILYGYHFTMDFKIFYSEDYMRYNLRDTSRAREKEYCVVVCRDVANRPHVGPGSVSGVPSVVVFLRDPSPYLCEFRRKHGKIRTARSTSVTKD